MSSGTFALSYLIKFVCSFCFAGALFLASLLVLFNLLSLL